MKLLAGHRVLAFGDMLARPLARYFGSLGAELVAFDGHQLENASFLVDGLGLELLEDAGWSRARIEAENPGLIHVSVTSFGSGGPRSRWKGGELIASATGGTLRLCGEMDRPPVKEAFDACTFHADMVAAAGAMAAHFARGAGGLGQHVDVSIQEVAFSRSINSIIGWQFDGRKLERVGHGLNYGKGVVRCIWKLADGWCFHSLMTGRFGAPANRALSDWIDEAGLPNPMAEVDWLAYDRSNLSATHRAEWEAAIAAFFETRSKSDIAGEGRRRGINACPLAEPADVLADEHLEAREFWSNRDGINEPSRFVCIREGRKVAPSTSSLAGQRPGPLSGVRVLDFSWALVGSIATKTLGDLGADVVKVESRTRPCLSRIDVQVSVSRPGNLDDKPWFAHLNSSKKSITLDIKRPEAREMLNPLIEWADVVVENFSPGTMAKLGLDYEKLAALNPGVVMASGSVFGQTGPLAREWGVDGTGAALSGRTFLTGWPDRDPVIPGAVPYGDVIVPYVMAATIAAALECRRTTGRGAYIDASMYEICVQQMRNALIDAQTGGAPGRVGNEDSTLAYQAVLPALGDDRWLAVSVRNEADLHTLRSVAGGADIAAWTATQRDHNAVAQLQAVGIAAGVVQGIEDLIENDPEIAARRALIRLEHLKLGAFDHVNTPIHFSRDRFEPYRAPEIGEHTASIARGIAGLSAERFDELLESEVFK